MSLLLLCNKTATVERKTTAPASPTNLGGHVNTWAEVYVDAPVCIQPASGSTRFEAGRLGIVVTNTIYFAPNDVYPAYAFHTGDRILHGDEIYLVQSSEDQAGQGRVYAAHALRKS